MLSYIQCWILCIESEYFLSQTSTLLHSERPKLHRVLAVLSAIGLSCTLCVRCVDSINSAWNFLVQLCIVTMSRLVRPPIFFLRVPVKIMQRKLVNGFIGDKEINCHFSGASVMRSYNLCFVKKCKESIKSQLHFDCILICINSCLLY